MFKKFFFLALLSVAYIDSRTALAGPLGSRVRALCQAQLQAASREELEGVSPGFAQRKATLLERDPYLTGEIKPEILKAFGSVGREVPPDKVLFWENFWWKESQEKQHLDLSPLGDKKLTEWGAQGVSIPKYTGEMLFEGDAANARLIVSAADARGMIDESQLAKLPSLHPKGSIDLEIVDKEGKLSDESFQDWARSMISISKLEGIREYADKKLADGNRGPFYFFEKKTDTKGITTYRVKFNNLVMSNSHVTWFVENVQRALAPDDIAAQRLEYLKSSGQAPVSDVSEVPRITSPMRSSGVSNDVWAEIEELQRQSRRNSANSPAIEEEAGRGRPQRQRSQRRAPYDASRERRRSFDPDDD